MRFAMIGYGAVGRAFALALVDSGATAVGIGLRMEDPDRKRADADGMKLFTPGNLPLDTELLILAVPDTAVETTAEMLAARCGSGGRSLPGTVLHFAGRYGLKPLEPLRAAGWKGLAFHPIQTFTRGAGPERFHGITAGVTADENALPVAREIARRLEVTVVPVPEEDRGRYHHASVLASNFLPLLVDLAASRLDGLFPSRREAVRALLPLVRGMIDNLERLAPDDALTGPVARNDFSAIEEHLEGWNDSAGREVYLLLVRNLVEFVHRNGRISADQANVWCEKLEQLHR